LGRRLSRERKLGWIGAAAGWEVGRAAAIQADDLGRWRSGMAMRVCDFVAVAC